MKSDIIESLSNYFDDHSQTTENGIEFWFARDIQHLLGYSEWRNFQKVVVKTKHLVKLREIVLQTILLTSTKWLNSDQEVNEKLRT